MENLTVDIDELIEKLPTSIEKIEAWFIQECLDENFQMKINWQ